MLLPLLVATSVVVTAFNSPSGTLIVDLKAPPPEGLHVGTTPKWVFEFKDGDLPDLDAIEFHPDLPGFVIETSFKASHIHFRYKIVATYCDDHNACRRQRFTGIAAYPNPLQALQP